MTNWKLDCHSRTLVLNIYSVQQHPILNYEYGTEESGTNNWALHIWVHPEANLFFCSTEQCLSQLHVKPYRWNFVALSYDFADGKLEWEAYKRVGCTAGTTGTLSR